MALIKHTNIRHKEPFEKEERAFLIKHARKQKKSFLRATHYVFLGLGIFMMALYTFANFTYDPANTDQKTDTPLSPQIVLWIALFLFLVFAVVFLYVYLISVYNLFIEIRRGYKIIEQATIREKKYMQQTQTYHFFINSLVKKSIEVSKEDYDFFQINDEINIEYGPRSFQFFGYY